MMKMQESIKPRTDSLWMALLTLSAVVLISGLSGCKSTSAVRGYRHAGIVMDDQQRPVANATVEIYRHIAESSYLSSDLALEAKVRTDDRGVFWFPVLDPATMLVARAPTGALTWQSVSHLKSNDLPVFLIIAEPAEIAGRVVNPSGQPVAGAEVWAAEAVCLTRLGEERLGSGRLTGKPAREFFRTRTAADGRFLLQGVPSNCGVNLAVTKPGLAMREPDLNPDNRNPYLTQCAAGQRDVRLVVEPAATIQGRVFEQTTGRPLGGVVLWLRRDAATHSFFSGREPIESESDGRFRFDGVASGAYHIIAHIGPRTDAMPDWVAEPVAVAANSGQMLSGVAVPMIKGGILEVTTVDQESRQPLGGALVAANKPFYQANASSSPQGTTRFRLPPGEYQFSAMKGLWAGDLGRTTVEDGHTNHVKAELSPPRIFTGTVWGPGGIPAPDVHVSVRGGNGESIRTDAQGQFRMVWNPRSLSSEDAGARLGCLFARDWTRDLAVGSDIDSTTTKLDLTLKPGLTLAGRVTAEDGTPVPNAHTKLMLMLSNLRSGSSVSLDQGASLTDAQGQFEFRVLPQGRSYRIQVGADGHGFISRELKMDETRTNHLELAFVLKRANLTLAGRVVDSEGSPLAGAFLSVSGTGQPHNSARTDADGRFELQRVCAGPVQVSALYQSSFVSVPAEGGDTNLLIKIAVKKPAEPPAP
jgi:hypothetical protein